MVRNLIIGVLFMVLVNICKKEDEKKRVRWLFFTWRPHSVHVRSLASFFWTAHFSDSPSLKGIYANVGASLVGNIGHILSVVVDHHQLYMEHQQRCSFHKAGFGARSRPGRYREHVCSVPEVDSFVVWIWWVKLGPMIELNWSAKFLTWSPDHEQYIRLEFGNPILRHVGLFIPCFDWYVLFLP